MHDFRVKEAKEMQTGALKDRVHELKETEKGVEHMCKEMEQLCDEARMDEKKEIARNLNDMGLPIEQIAQALKVNAQMVQEWLAGSVSTARQITAQTALRFYDSAGFWLAGFLKTSK